MITYSCKNGLKLKKVYKLHLAVNFEKKLTPRVSFCGIGGDVFKSIDDVKEYLGLNWQKYYISSAYLPIKSMIPRYEKGIKIYRLKKVYSPIKHIYFKSF